MGEDTTTSTNGTDIAFDIMEENSGRLIKMDPKSRPAEEPAHASDAQIPGSRNITFNFNTSQHTITNVHCSGGSIGSGSIGNIGTVINHCRGHAHNRFGGGNHEGQGAGGNEGATPRNDKGSL